ncbi:MAG: SDR family NAD(P)-dependent oxidoreductase [Candidatus Eremiobacteraeota bacterium]|nr:SDR family NAD(P)-dependent oxidoreductase [Candidatus Eremiobacteraeota bacterium]
MDKIVLITGASRGIGAATARLLAHNGYAVAINYRARAEAAEKVAQEIRENGGRAITVRADVAAEAEVVAMFETVDRQLGRLTGLVNNAGILERQCRVEDLTFERLQRVLTTNVIGSFLCAREAVSRKRWPRPSCGCCLTRLLIPPAAFWSWAAGGEPQCSCGAAAAGSLGKARRHSSMVAWCRSSTFWMLRW